MQKTNVIAVDLDGTLTFTDTLYESLILFVKNKPLLIFSLLFWLLSGRATLKAKLAKHVELDVTTLPYNQSLINWLKIERSLGKIIVLCSATNVKVARAVAAHLQLFDHVIASDEITNIKSSQKRKVLEEKFGEKGYDYIGNSYADLSVWIGAKQAILVNTSRSVQRKASQVANIYKVFPAKGVSLKSWLKTFRVHQWLKNTLLFVPLLAAHQVTNIQFLSTLFLAFISFSLCASSVYMTNDLLDLESDRRHPRKKNRPFAAATIPITAGALLIPICIFASLTLGLMVGPVFLSWLIFYLVLTTTYSVVLKQIVLVDCLTLASLYTVRIAAGAAAVSIQLSFWLLAFSVFIFLSLAFVKRFIELELQAKIGNKIVHGRGYKAQDSQLLQTMGVSSGYAAVLVLALYLQSDNVTMLYSQPLFIWATIPLIHFWISWVWIKAARDEVHDDPVVFAIKDKTSLVVAILTTIAVLFASKGVSILW
ncbi:MAG: UbiA family prenyltransferase [Pseudomonadota bacterium]|nr:UbiA family prenyltransferase [Pseudomonadota bacterium]